MLKQNRIDITEVPENSEVRLRHAMNFVTVAPGTIIMPSGCPRTKKFFRKAGIRVAAELSVTQFINGGGGLACATGILSRETTS